MVVQQGSCEVVDGSDGTKCHGSILAPQQIGPKHHGQVSIVHLVHLTPCRHLQGQASVEMESDTTHDHTLKLPYGAKGQAL